VTLTSIILLMFAVPAAWWLSGFDPQVTGENPRKDYLRRAARCLGTAILLWVFFGLDAVRVGLFFIPLILIIPPAVGILWAGCIGALLARGFHRLIDSGDGRPFDPKADARNLDMVASLLREGRKDEAVQLCEELKKSGCANVLVLETMLARAGIPQPDSKKPTPLVEAHRLRSEGKFGAAETLLQSLLAETPADVEAALALMRLYARNLHRTDKAMEVLRALEKQPDVPAGHLEYARRSIVEWSQKESAPATDVPPVRGQQQP
jgi:hypothetical protein